MENGSGAEVVRVDPNPVVLAAESQEPVRLLIAPKAIGSVTLTFESESSDWEYSGLTWIGTLNVDVEVRGPVRTSGPAAGYAFGPVGERLWVRLRGCLLSIAGQAAQG